MTRGLLRRGASPRIDRRAPRVRVQARARTYVHPLWHAESQLRGHRVRPRALSPGQARLVTCPMQQQTRVVQQQSKRVSPHTPCRTIPDEIRGGARAGASARSRSALRDRSARPRSDASSPRRRRRVRLGARALWRGAATHAPKLSSEITSSESLRHFYSERETEGSVDSLFALQGVFVLFEPAGGQLRRAPLCITDRTHGHSRSPWRASCRCPTGR